MKKLTMLTCLSMVLSWSAVAADLTVGSLSGRWLFTHMNLDGMGERSVNLPMEFLSDGTVINYDAAGKEKSTASFKIENGTILYEDSNGTQKWRVKSFSDDQMQVDHSGAEMHFRRLN